jgi:hypothetical protein
MAFSRTGNGRARLVTAVAFLGSCIALTVGTGEGGEYDAHEQRWISDAYSRSDEGDNALAERLRKWWRDQVRFAADVRAALALNAKGGRQHDDRTDILPMIRIRGGVTIAPASRLSATARLAMFVDKEAQGVGFQLEHRRTIQSGDITFDSLFLTLRPHELVKLEVGRLQTQFEIDSVVKDSLSRNDSGGLSVTWTDGMHLTLGSPSSFRVHLIGQLNPSEGPTNGVGARGPVDFSEGASRVTYYVALEAPPIIPFTQLVADLTIIPNVLRPQGLGTEPKGDLIGMTVKAAADVSVGDWARPVVLHPFVEFGAMFETPQERAVGISASESPAGPFALVGGIDLKHLGPGDLGCQTSWIQAGYLLSPDYPNDTWSIETRYKVSVAPNAVLEIRYRHRQDIHRRIDAPDRQTDDNILARITLRF